MGITVSLHVQDRHVYIVGGGQVALRKAKQFLREGAIVHVIAKAFLPEFQTMDQLHRIEQSFTWDLVKQPCFFMYVASNDTVLNQQLILEAKQKNILCGCAIFDEQSGFYSRIEEKKPYIEFSLSTKGKCPGADRQLLHELDAVLQVMDERVSILQIFREWMPHARSEAMVKLSKLSLENLRIIQDAYTSQMPVLVLAYHGVVDVSRIQSTLTSFHQLVKHEFPSHKVVYGFLSSKIMEKVRKLGHHMNEVNSLVDALQVLNLSYAIQPMLLQKGIWFEMLTMYNPLGECLLEQVQDAQEVYEMIKKNSQKNCLFIYHDAKNNVFEHLRLQHKDQVLALSKMPKSIPSTMHIVPLFLFLGYHVQKDIKQQFPSFCISNAVGLMEMHEIQCLFIKKIRKLLENI